MQFKILNAIYPSKELLRNRFNIENNKCSFWVRQRAVPETFMTTIKFRHVTARYGGDGVPHRSQAWGRDSSESAWWLGCSSWHPAGPSPNERHKAIPQWAHHLQG
ncbi:hypothetical protein GOODEAATRI_018129 [Goodea atripinnis]|uniref:Uncharacterized protein n=1 Tax=Goodea atripinnis TaxID=208336 RepID=A0ABV0PQA7_9TELE